MTIYMLQGFETSTYSTHTLFYATCPTKARILACSVYDEHMPGFKAYYQHPAGSEEQMKHYDSYLIIDSLYPSLVKDGYDNLSKDEVIDIWMKRNIKTAELNVLLHHAHVDGD